MPKPGYKQSPKHKKRRAQAIIGEANPAYKDGRRSYRRKAGAMPHDGSVVHHKSGDRANNSKSNLERLTDGTAKHGRKTTPKHEKTTKRAQKSDHYWQAFRSHLLDPAV